MIGFFTDKDKADAFVKDWKPTKYYGIEHAEEYIRRCYDEWLYYSEEWGTLHFVKCGYQTIYTMESEVWK